MRIAFITPEFVTDYKDGGGLGNYLNRIGKLLVEHGHHVEVFVSSHLEPRILIHEGIRVERVPPISRKLTAKVLRRLCALAGLGVPLAFHSQARALASTMERRHRDAPFDIVQSADYRAVGLAVRRAKGRVHLVRCSCPIDLYNEADDRKDRRARWQEKLERAAIRRADKAYAPSRLVADHYQNQHGIVMHVLRPPVALEVAPATERPCGLPKRFLLYFGQLTRRKGLIWLGEALNRAFVKDSTLRMVWIGRGDFGEIGKVLSELGPHRSKVQVLYPLTKPELYSLIRHAEASVLPSLVDNLPNTVIESLMLGTPVIGTRGASIDELVEHGVTGELVSKGDVEGLASAIVRAWKGESSFRKGFEWYGGLAAELQPDRAIENFLTFGGRNEPPD